MNLEERASKVNKFGDRTIIVEFDNGYSVMYDKPNGWMDERIRPNDFLIESPEVFSQIFPPDRSLDFDLELERRCDLTLAKINSFSKKAQKLLKTYTSPSYERMKHVEPEISELYDKILEPFDIKAYKYMDLTKGFPHVCPWPLLPFLIAQMISNIPGELISPSGKAYRVCNKKMLTPKTDGTYAALIGTSYFQNTDKIRDKRHISIIIPTKNDKYVYLWNHQAESIGKDNIFSEENMVYEENRYKNIKQSYALAKHYFQIDKDVKNKLLDLVNKRDSEYASWVQFKESLNATNQMELLNSIGFLGD